MTKIKVKVDKNLCLGCGTCVGVCPEVFKIGDDGKSVVNEQYANEINDPAIIERTNNAKIACPTQAIIVTEI